MKQIVSIEALRKIIEASNENFATMTTNEKKVVVAQDCIERINLGQISADTGNVINRNTITKMNKSYSQATSVKDILNNDEMIQCDVCAKGGLFLSYVGRTNEVKLCELGSNTTTRNYNPNSVHDNEHSRLLEIFTARELAYIELAFEGEQYLDYDENSCRIKFTDDEYELANNFRCSFDTPDDVLVAICENIIKNKGQFIL